MNEVAPTRKKMAFIDLTNYKDWPIGGMLSYEIAIIRNLSKYYDIDLWGVSVDDSINDSVTIGGINYIIHRYANVNTKKKIIPNFWKGTAIAFNKEFKNNKYDIVYAHSGSCMTGARLSGGSKPVYVYHQHGLSYITNHSLMSYTQKPFYWIAQRVAEVVFLVTDDDSARKYAIEMKKKSKASFWAIGSPINLNDYNLKAIKRRIEKNKGMGTKCFIYVGRLSPEKNVGIMIEAFSKYKKMFDGDSVLRLVGDGPDRENLESIVKKLKLEKDVIFYGSKSHNETIELLETSDVFLITSNGEGVSIAVLEAYASGLPVICFSVPGLCSQVLDGETGLVTSVHTDEAFAKNMKKIDDFRTPMALACIRRASLYDEKKIAETIYNKIEIRCGDK